MPPFEIIARDGASAGRRGILSTAHGEIETPCFLPVGTRGAVKGVTFDLLEAWDCRAVLANTYHLMARPMISGPGRRAARLRRLAAGHSDGLGRLPGHEPRLAPPDHAGG